MAEPKTAKKPGRRKKALPEHRSRGIAPDAIRSGSLPAAVSRLAESIEADGGSVLASYKDPLGGHWQIFAALPIELVEPTPYQRDLSQPHVERLSAAMAYGRFVRLWDKADPELQGRVREAREALQEITRERPNSP